jgi:hypothetical protein
MKRVVVLLMLMWCFSCKEDIKSVFVFTNEVPVPKEAILLANDFMSIKTLNNKQLFSKYFESHSLDSLYRVSNQLIPNNFIADFNRDSQHDLAVFVRNVRNDKAGFICLHSSTNFFSVAKGHKNLALDDVCCTEFTIDKSKIAYETIIDSISGDIIDPKQINLGTIALHIKEFEVASGGLNRDGLKYIYRYT